MLKENKMTQSEQLTWNELKSLNLDDEQSKLKFSDRLGRENNWTKEFSVQLIEEYKKFVFLAKHAGHPVTPSVEVDEVWHLHMIYTQSYWNDMCKKINLQLHHGPTKGGKQEGEKFTDWYTNTLESYKKYFGTPSKQFWPDKEKRFAPNTIKKVDTKDYFVFKKPKFSLRTSLPVLSFIPLILLFSFIDYIDWDWVLIGVIVLVIIFIIIRGIIRRNRRGGGGSSSGGSSSASSCGFLGGFFCGSSGCGSSSSGCGSSCGSSCGGGCGGCGS